MKQRFIFCIWAAFLTLCFPVVSAQAQDSIVNTFTKEVGNYTTGYGRDFWVAFPQNQFQNYTGLGAGDDTTQAAVFAIKTILVGSERNTFVKLQVQGSPDTVVHPVIAGQITILQGTQDTSGGKGWGDVPRKTELYTSGIVKKDRAIHVWSDDADLAVYAESSLGGNEGMYIVPAMGWGTEYVVASFTSNYYHGIGYYPSEFVVIADEDSTVITVTPSHNIRSNDNWFATGHALGKPFTQLLNTGECVQYQAVAPQTDINDQDLTGTVVTSNKPVGVIGANASGVIPVSDETKSFIIQTKYLIDMMPPSRTWATSYFTAPFAGRKYGGDAFLIVASKDNQSISRNGQIVATLNKYGYLFFYDITDASKWTSASPFMLVQYMENADHNAPVQTQTLNFGNPSMVVINSAEQFGKKVIFQIPVQFDNYINVILPVANESKTTVDGYALDNIPLVSGIERLPIGNTNWEAIRISYPQDSAIGTHQIVSDTGVGVYLYGLNYSNSYTLAGTLGVVTPFSIDKQAPTGAWNNNGFSTTVHMKDNQKNDTHLSEIEIDSLVNMKYVRDYKFIAGAGRDSSFYDLKVIDTTKPAYALISAYDFAGNRTRVESKYTIQPTASFSLKDFDFGCIDTGTTKKINATIAKNETSVAVTIDKITVEDNIHFSFTGVPQLPLILKGNGNQSFEFSYTPTTKENDTTIVHFHSKEARTQMAKLTGCGLIPATGGVSSYTSSLSSGSAEYMQLSSQLDAGAGLALLPPRPNPVTSVTQSVQFIYGLKSESPLDLSLYDLLGNHITTMFHEEHHPAGIYGRDFSISPNILSGSYIYRLQAAEKILSGKLIIEH